MKVLLITQAFNRLDEMAPPAVTQTVLDDVTGAQLAQIQTNIARFHDTGSHYGGPREDLRADVIVLCASRSELSA